MKQITAKITNNRKIAPDFYKMRIESAYLAQKAKPGQFIEVRCLGKTEPLLRRPLGCHRIFGKGIEVLYEVVGKGTALLAGKTAGEGLDIIGPLGRGFDLSVRSSDVILVAGGIGVAPLVALAEGLAKKKNKIYVAIGARAKSHILCEKEFKSLGCIVKTSTDDGSKGQKGFVTKLLKDFLTDPRIRPVRIYACGPNTMLQTVSGMARTAGVECQVSLEERMACGVGVCLGCPVKTREGLIDITNKMVCKDGPVFNAEEIVW